MEKRWGLRGGRWGNGGKKEHGNAKSIMSRTEPSKSIYLQGTGTAPYRRQIDFSCSNVQWGALVIVAHVNVHPRLDVAPHECHVAREDTLAQVLCHRGVRVIETAGRKQACQSLMLTSMLTPVLMKRRMSAISPVRLQAESQPFNHSFRR